MFNVFYGTVGLFLDIIFISLPILKYLKIERSKIIKFIVISFVFNFVIFNTLPIRCKIIKLLLMYCVFGFNLKIVGVEIKKLYLFLLMYTILYLLDFVGFITFNAKTFFVYNNVYKILIIPFFNIKKLTIKNDDVDYILKIKILLSIIIPTSLTYGIIYLIAKGV